MQLHPKSEVAAAVAVCKTAEFAVKTSYAAPEGESFKNQTFATDSALAPLSV